MFCFSKDPRTYECQVVWLLWTLVFFLTGIDFQNTTTVEFENNWKHLQHFPIQWNFLHDEMTECKCGSNSKLTWAQACRKKQKMCNHNTEMLHFHPKTRVDCRPHSVATGNKTCCFTIHVDDLNVRHHKVKGTSFTTFGCQMGFFFCQWKDFGAKKKKRNTNPKIDQKNPQIHNTKAQAQRHEFFVRTSFLPSDKQIWSLQHQLEIISKELETMKGGIPIPVDGEDGKFEIIKFVCLGVVADGPQIGKLLGRTGLKGYCGNQLIRENLRISKSFVGTDTMPVFNSRRYLTNKVCDAGVSSWFFFYVVSECG